MPSGRQHGPDFLGREQLQNAEREGALRDMGTPGATGTDRVAAHLGTCAHADVKAQNTARPSRRGGPRSAFSLNHQQPPQGSLLVQGPRCRPLTERSGTRAQMNR